MRNQPRYKFFKNWGYAMAGFRDIFKNESSFRIELYTFLLGFCLLFVLNFGLLINLFLIFSMILVLVCECINSAIERVVDLASPDLHPLAGAVKDAASTGVMFCNILCATLWIYAILVKFGAL